MSDKKIKIIKVTEEDLQEKVKSVPFTERFVPIESTYRIRTTSHKDGGVKVYGLELVAKDYKLIQRIHVGSKDTNIKKIGAKLSELGVEKKILEKGLKDFYRKYTG